MLTAFALTASLLSPLALAAAPIDDTPAIESASAQLQDGRLAAEIVTTLPMFREDLRAKLDGRTLVLYVTGAVIPGSKKVYGEGTDAVRALARATYTKLEIPFPAGAACAGTPAIALDETVIKVSVGCGSGAAAPTRVVRAEALTEKLLAGGNAEVATPAKTAVVETPAANKNDAAKPEAPVTAKAPEAKAPEAKISETAKATVAKTDVKTDIVVKNDAPVAKATPVSVSKSEPTAVGPRPSESSMPTMLIGFLMVAGAFAFMFWRKRKQQHSGLIRILETASLGPKRTIVVAEIDGEKMILGTSEAGISVLTPASRLPSPFSETTRATMINMPPGFAEETTGTARRADQAALVVAAAASTRIAAQADKDVAEDNEGGLLARLFRRQGANNAVTETDHNLGNMEDDFRDLLTDSLEDEELRRRLQSGLGGRIS
jgi:flagellar biogenesis protein FliO